MNSEVLKFSSIDQSKLLILHQFHQCPESLRKSLDVVQQVSCDEVHPLNVANFSIVDTVCHQYLSKHLSKPGVASKSRAVGVSAVDVFINLVLVLDWRSNSL